MSRPDRRLELAALIGAAIVTAGWLLGAAWAISRAILTW
jgi:hypothetical protein